MRKMHAFDSFRFYLPSPCVVDVVHVDRVVGKKYLTFIVWSALLNIEHDSFSRIVNTRFIDKTINFTTAHCNNDFSTPSPPFPFPLPRRGVGWDLARPQARSMYHSRFATHWFTTVNAQQSVCNSQCTTFNVQQSLSLDVHRHFATVYIQQQFVNVQLFMYNRRFQLTPTSHVTL